MIEREPWQRTHTCEEVTPDLDGKEIVVNGWVQNVRPLGSLLFIVLRDETGTRQVTVVKKKHPEPFQIFKTISRESVVSVKGTVRAYEEAPNGVEILPTKVTILSKAQTPLPFDPFEPQVKTLKDTRYDWRILDLRHPEKLALFKIRSTVLFSTCEYMQQRGFTYWTSPKVLGQASEGGAEVFDIQWFDKKAYLSMSPQLHKQFIAGNTGTKFFEITPYFRAEKHRTRRHLSEFTGIDGEIPFATEEDVWEVLEGLLVHVSNAINERNKEELKILGKQVKPLKTPFPRISYKEALEKLQELGHEIPWGEDLNDQQERALYEAIGSPFFIHSYPSSLGKFYVMKFEDNPELCHAYDLVFHVELASGARREHRYEKLLENLEEKGLDPKDFESYLDAFKYGCAPHAGFGMGIERLVMGLLDIQDIWEVVPFPRTVDRLAP